MNELSTGNIDVNIEDDNIHSSFAKILKDFRVKFGNDDLREIAMGFKMVTYQKLMTLYDSDPSQTELISNWILECKFWTILESLLDVKFNKQIHSSLMKNNEIEVEDEMGDICEYSSDTVLQDKIISSNNELSQIYTCMSVLSDTFKLDFANQSEYNDENDNDNEIENLQTTKWLNTMMNLNNINPDEKKVKNLDIDSPLRTNLEIDKIDKEKDEIFFKRAFKLLLSNDYEDLKTLCELTNNWDFSLLLSGLNDRIDPIIDLNDFSYKTIPSGIKSRIIRRRTIYQLANSEKLKNSPYERGCYGILSSDFITSNELTNNWEEKLYLYLDNLLKDKLETKILKQYEKLNLNSEINLISKLSKPPVISNSISDILNKLSNDKNPIIQEQSKNSIRVLIGSIISDNVKTLMNNTIKSLDDILLSDENFQNELTNKSYLLRILTHLAIILQLIYGEEIINNKDYTKLLKCYILRLILYKSYELVPIYISFIPTDEEIVEIYSSLLFQFEYSSIDRDNQINGMRHLSLPLESILRKTIEKAFHETIKFYPTNNEIQLNYKVDEIDEKLYSTIYWFIDSGMTFDCLDSIIILLRRFLLVGKIGSAIKFLSSISLPQLIDNYKYETSVLTNINSDDEKSKQIDEIQQIPNYKILELTQYHNLFNTFNLIIDYQNNDEKSIENLTLVIDSLLKLVKDWLFDLVNDNYNDEIISIDIEIYKELRRIYIPTIFNTLFDILIENKDLNKKFISKSIDLVNLLADEEFKLYEILISTNELKPFLLKLSNVSCYLYSEFNDGIYI